MRNNSRATFARETPFDVRSNFVYCPIIATIVFADVKYFAGNRFRSYFHIRAMFFYVYTSSSPGSVPFYRFDASACLISAKIFRHGEAVCAECLWPQCERDVYRFDWCIDKSTFACFRCIYKATLYAIQNEATIHF